VSAVLLFHYGSQANVRPLTLLSGGCILRVDWSVLMSLSKQERNCRRKEAMTKKEATVKAQLRSVQKNIALHVYQCDVCGWWHLTKSPRR
jgi:hypothetical protein